MNRALLTPESSILLPSAHGAEAMCDRPAAKPARTRTECGDMPFLVQRDGTWLYRGSPIGRKELVCLFSSVLLRDRVGDYWLETPVERGRIQVEDTPWVAVEMDWRRCGQGRNQSISFRTNVDQVVTAGPEHPLRVAHNAMTCEPIPYIHIRDGQGEKTAGGAHCPSGVLRTGSDRCAWVRRRRAEARRVELRRFLSARRPGRRGLRLRLRRGLTRSA